MVKKGDTVWYDHVEARHERKTRPAVVLSIIGETILLVVGQTERPEGVSVLVKGKYSPATRQAQLLGDTYFDCQQVIAAPKERIEGKLGRMPVRQFTDIDRATAEARGIQEQRVIAEAEPQRDALRARLQRHTQFHRCEIDDIADQARLARAHLRAIVAGTEWWDREELIRIAAVLEIDVARVLDDEPDSA